MKVVYDTGLYIDMLRASKHTDLFQSRSQIRYLSPIVIMELNAGAKTPLARKTLEKLYLPYSRGQRILSLNANSYYRAGEILQKLSSLSGTLGRHLSHDVLIALSTHVIGATLFTSNRKDFAAIRRHVPFSVEYLP